MTLDKLSLLVGCVVGVIVGLIIAYFLVLNGIDALGHSFQIQNVNITIDINETAIIEAQKQMRGIP